MLFVNPPSKSVDNQRKALVNEEINPDDKTARDQITDQIENIDPNDIILQMD